MYSIRVGDRLPALLSSRHCRRQTAIKSLRWPPQAVAANPWPKVGTTDLWIRGFIKQRTYGRDLLQCAMVERSGIRQTFR